MTGKMRNCRNEYSRFLLRGTRWQFVRPNFLMQKPGHLLKSATNAEEKERKHNDDDNWRPSIYCPSALRMSHLKKKEIHLVQIDNAEETYTVWSNKGESPRKRLKVWRGPYTMGLLFSAQLTQRPVLSPLRFHIKRNTGWYLPLTVAGVQRCSTRVLATRLHCNPNDILRAHHPQWICHMALSSGRGWYWSNLIQVCNHRVVSRSLVTGS